LPSSEKRLRQQNLVSGSVIPEFAYAASSAERYPPPWTDSQKQSVCTTFVSMTNVCHRQARGEHSKSNTVTAQHHVWAKLLICCYVVAANYLPICVASGVDNRSLSQTGGWAVRVRLRMLAACLSMADICHADESRAPRIVFDYLSMEEDSARTGSAYAISGINRSGNKILLSQSLFRRRQSWQSERYASESKLTQKSISYFHLS